MAKKEFTFHPCFPGRGGVLALVAVLAPLLLVPALPAHAAPSIACHCFQDRSYDPANPQRVDPYLLANARNSLLAAAFGLNKKEIVRARMGGTAGEELWIAHYLARQTGTATADLLRSRQGEASWPAALAARQIAPASTGPLFAAALAAGGSDADLATAAADEVLTGGVKVPPIELRGLRQAGGETGEIILALLISRRAERPAVGILADVRAGRTAWGELLQQVAILPAELEAAVRTLLP